jgi:hypothetical protein
MLDSGDKATITYNGTGSYISLEGGTTAQILRSDVALENGVMHVSTPFLFHGVDLILGYRYSPLWIRWKCKWDWKYIPTR